ncbi:hypothetical protein VTK73DRAFT_3012 [Phialemonium thermophilum]|uniref:Zn(2)-C6 fungal-type domain-containing protein n=1 Tax=Phialemonium thermophilum TaxID=223376 RepID=A0ABR3X1F2_9PEZI
MSSGPSASSAQSSSLTPPPSVSPDASDSNLRPRRARTSRPKVKTGCNNCKLRRIKCDEGRPSCQNCVRSKKICTGYPPPSRSAFPFEEIRIAPKPAPHQRNITGPVPAVAPASDRQREKFRKRSLEKEKVKTEPDSRTPPRTPAAAAQPVMLYRPSVNLPFTDQESLYFQLFREQTANELSGFFDNIFWSRGVLQECHSEPAIRHAVVALGALYKTLEKTCESPPGSPSDQATSAADSAFAHWEMAVKKYSQACHELVGLKSQVAERTLLMGSVLLACFDSFIGDHQQAIKQIQSGLGLLEQLRAQRRRSFLPKPEEPVEEELIQMFTRLAIQAKSYDMAFHFPHPYVIRLTDAPRGADPNSPTSSSEGNSPVSLHHDPIPDRFQSSREARLAWDALVERIFRFTETMFTYVSNGPMGVLPSNLQQYGAGFKDQIQAWSDAYEHILASRNGPGVSSQEKAAIAVLKMSQIMSQVLFLMTFSGSEMQFDSYTDEFRAIVDLALEVVGDEERRAAAKRCPDRNFCQHHAGFYDSAILGSYGFAARHIKPSFSADLGIVPPLFVVATKCRDPLLRRQAIQLLRSSSRREGMWDSELAARIGAWVASVEEQNTSLAAMGHAASPAQTGAINQAARATAQSRISTNGHAAIHRHNPSYDFGDNIPLGPGGNARYDVRRGSQALNVSMLTASRPPKSSAVPAVAPVIPENNRVMIKAVQFDLRERFATIQLGTRGLPTGTWDSKKQTTRITW